MPVMKKEADGEHPASHYAYVPDATSPNTWKLRIDDAAHVGGAIAALGKGFRGQKVEIPGGDRAAVVAKVKAAWLKFHPDKEAADFPLGEADELATSEDVEVVMLAEALDIEGDFEALVETKLRRDGSVPVKVIRPGWGTSGYYPSDTLSRDAKVFEGARMFWNHPKRSDDDERPERDLNDLAAVLSNVHYSESGPKGPGIYGDAKVFSPYKERVAELAPYIGVSILASGKGTKGEAEGKTGLVIEAITAARSVDFVTAPGAGGEVLSLFEAAGTSVTDGGVNDTGAESAEEVNSMDELKEAQAAVAQLTEDNAQLAEANADLKERLAWFEEKYRRLREAEVLTEARDIVAASVEEADLPEVTKKRLIESLASDPLVIVEGDEVSLDKTALDEAVASAIKGEVEYLAALSESGRIARMGGSGSDEKPEVTVEELSASFARLGLSESAAKSAAIGRN